jgi:hypothetical protein
MEAVMSSETSGNFEIAQDVLVAICRMYLIAWSDMDWIYLAQDKVESSFEHGS